jgi:histidinol-phosphate/aromatic aminotransferase/cobyric acid decarboxylase-like protein
MSMAVASVLMRERHSYVVPAIAAICDARDWLRATILNDLQVRTWGSVANHVLVEWPSTVGRDSVRDGLAARGVLVKADYPAPLDRHMLITCGARPLMEAFYNHLLEAVRCA